ncbi:hypothetical protein SS1G_08498 [Sclerotinia sclerotiorum 1980 UF-70]|uniref:Plasma membrane proteolipid 3 n=2 Tax=Sclerotinia sclerotiorum (strain ATCC 18683 / 1980 / Ss-1) TaxID=665079 RepID=A7ET43_SCLS1|nr:hypothetical protein SS1G_08498 [Sclerotinia sclerotiorum 1980 UF-70]APA13002.1 hypothetical protein sscle_10g077720 [Sclerotinia sclerotiorum 1980 UF-70]EDN92635.1 hypothetical protein SS1G_08498 [Sclerotinia sclerotiorum 1980 UF-70]
MAVAGIGADCLLNTILFMLGVIPGHIHGFYITCTYFSRRKKVRKGQYPGGPKMGIYSERVWYGGASAKRVDELWEKREDERLEKSDRDEEKRTGRRKAGDRRGVGRRNEVMRMHSDIGAMRVH